MSATRGPPAHGRACRFTLDPTTPDAPSLVRCAILDPTGLVACWGDDGAALHVPASLGVVVSLAVGATRACAVQLVTEAVECWEPHNATVPFSRWPGRASAVAVGGSQT